MLSRVYEEDSGDRQKGSFVVRDGDQQRWRIQKMEEEDEGQPTPIKSEGRKRKEKRIAMCEESKGRDSCSDVGVVFSHHIFSVFFVPRTQNSSSPSFLSVLFFSTLSRPRQCIYICINGPPSFPPSLCPSSSRGLRF